MQVEHVALSELQQDPSNVREHSPRNIEAIARSLYRFGQQKPIVVNAFGVIVAGNGTFAGALLLAEGWRPEETEGVPLTRMRQDWTRLDVVRTELMGLEARAYAVADNRTTDLSNFADDDLAQLLADLAEEDASLVLDAGYMVDEMIALMPEDPIDLDGASEPPSDPGSGLQPDDGGGGSPAALGEISLRVVQLFFDADTQPVFIRRAAELTKQLGTDNVTDTVFACVERLHDELCGEDGGIVSRGT